MKNNNYQMQFESLMKMIYKNAEDNKYDMKGNEALRNFIKKYVVYALDVKEIKSDDIDMVSLDSINALLRKSKFNIKRKRLKGIAVDDGVSAFAFSIINNKLFFDAYRVMLPFTEAGDELKEVYLFKDNDTVKLNEDKSYQKYYRYSYSDSGQVMKTLYYGTLGMTDRSKLVISKEDSIIYDIDRLPVVILPNNEDYESTFEYADGIIETAGKHLENIDKEWEYDKSMLINNNLFEPERTADTVQYTIEEGETRVIDQKDPNGQYGQSLSYLSSGGISSQVAQRNYDKYKQEALFYTLSWLVVSDGKTNKHGAEVITSQLPSFNNIQFQIELMEEFYSHFIYLLAALGNQTKQLDITLDKLPKIDVALSPMLEQIVNMTNQDGKNNITDTEETNKEK